TGSVTSVSAAPDGVTVASGGLDGTVKLWKLADGAQLRSVGSGSPVRTIALGATVLVAGDDEGPIKGWNPLDGSAQRSLVGDTAAIQTVVLKRDGSALASGSRDLTLRLWRISDGAETFSLRIAGGGDVRAIAVSDDWQFATAAGPVPPIPLWSIG